MNKRRYPLRRPFNKTRQNRQLHDSDTLGSQNTRLSDSTSFARERDKSYGAVAALAEWAGVVQEDVYPLGNNEFQVGDLTYNVISGDDLVSEILLTKYTWIDNCIANLPSGVFETMLSQYFHNLIDEWSTAQEYVRDDVELLWYSDESYDIIDDYYIFSVDGSLD